MEKILTSIIEGFNKDLKVMVFEGCNLLDFIVFNMSNLNFNLNDSGKTIKQGYIGQLTQLSNRIIECSEKEEYIKK